MLVTTVYYSHILIDGRGRYKTAARIVADGTQAYDTYPNIRVYDSEELLLKYATRYTFNEISPKKKREEVLSKVIIDKFEIHFEENVPNIKLDVLKEWGFKKPIVRKLSLK